MNNINSNQLSNASQSSIGNIEQRAAQLKQNQQQLEFQNVQQYVKTAQPNTANAYTNTVEQNAKQLEIQNAKNYIQKMNGQIGLK